MALSALLRGSEEILGDRLLYKFPTRDSTVSRGHKSENTRIAIRSHNQYELATEPRQAESSRDGNGQSVRK